MKHRRAKSPGGSQEQSVCCVVLLGGGAGQLTARSLDLDCLGAGVVRLGQPDLQDAVCELCFGLLLVHVGGRGREREKAP